jgi:hypothetical protein
MIMKDLFNEIGIIMIFVIFAVIMRTAWHLGPNIEVITGLSVLTMWVVSRKYLAILVPILSMIISDVFIGNNLILIFTWSGFLFTPLLAWLGKFIIEKYDLDQFEFIAFLSSGLGGTILFYLWTNFGVVLVSGLYPQTLEGLFASYVNALPFLRNQLLGNFLVLTGLFAGLTFARKIKKHDLIIGLISKSKEFIA